MEKYLNLSGKSGVAWYVLGEDSITINFTTGGVYLYNYQKPGFMKVTEMKRLAVAGKGLNTYISKFVKDQYDQKLA
jgi:hypothetical protein